MRRTPADYSAATTVRRVLLVREETERGSDAGKRRIPELDSLRGLAAIAIVLFHYSYPSRLYDSVLYAGNISLELFFVLSGFLITSILLTQRGRGPYLRRFYVRRALRIWPIYYLFLGGIIMAALCRPGLWPIGDWLRYATFTQNPPLPWANRIGSFAYPMSHTWSLAVEEQFYLLWPLLLVLTGRQGKGMIPLTCAVVATAIGARAYGVSTWSLLGRCDGFALGGLLAWLLDQPRATPRGLDRGLAVLGFAALNYLTWGMLARGLKPFSIDGPTFFVDITIIDLLFCALIGLIVRESGRPLLAPLRARWLRYLGTISYGTYLYHLVVIVLVAGLCKRLGISGPWAAPIAASILCLALASASWFLIERPILNLKQRFRYREAGEVVSGGTHPQMNADRRR